MDRFLITQRWSQCLWTPVLHKHKMIHPHVPTSDSWLRFYFFGRIPTVFLISLVCMSCSFIKSLWIWSRCRFLEFRHECHFTRQKTGARRSPCWRRDDGRSRVPASEERIDSPTAIIHSRRDVIFTGEHRKQNFWSANPLFVLGITSPMTAEWLMWMFPWERVSARALASDRTLDFSHDCIERRSSIWWHIYMLLVLEWRCWGIFPQALVLWYLTLFSFTHCLILIMMIMWFVLFVCQVHFSNKCLWFRTGFVELFTYSTCTVNITRWLYLMSCAAFAH